MGTELAEITFPKSLVYKKNANMNFTLIGGLSSFRVCISVGGFGGAFSSVCWPAGGGRIE